MTKLARLLGNSHPLFRYNIEQLEKATGNAGIDIRLAAEILQRAHGAMRAIGLDPKDTTADELYAALYSFRENSALDECDFVIYELGKERVSFNRDDIEENHRYQYRFGENVLQHAVERLKLELVSRYAKHERTIDANVKVLFDEVGISTKPGTPKQ